MISPSPAERVSHVVRRLSMGAHPDVMPELTDTDAAIDRALDLSAPAPAPFELAEPADYDTGRDPAQIAGPIGWWLSRMVDPSRMIEERLTWFWHDHFATSLAKVPVPYLLWRQHMTIRGHALGNFADLLKAVAKDPAMLVYLDGTKSTVREHNENFGRECMELFTMGRDSGYTQDDVVAASRSFTGWVVDLPGRPGKDLGSPWNAVFVPRRHDEGPKTLLGVTGALDMDGALDVILDQPATARFIAAKLHRELVGLPADEAALDRLAAAFAADYEILPLVRAIVAEPAFTSDAAVRAKVRTPLERTVAILQAAGAQLEVTSIGGRGRKRGPLSRALRSMSYLPFLPPNVAGFPKGDRLLGPSSLVHAFDLLQAIDAPPPDVGDTDQLLARFGVFDISDATRAVLEAQTDPATRFALAATSPEVTLT